MLYQDTDSVSFGYVLICDDDDDGLLITMLSTILIATVTS